MGCELTVLETVFAFEEASVVRADVCRERVLPEAHLGELVRRHAVAAQPVGVASLLQSVSSSSESDSLLTGLNGVRARQESILSRPPRHGRSERQMSVKA